jgi:hypothetical protein
MRIAIPPLCAFLALVPGPASCGPSAKAETPPWVIVDLAPQEPLSFDPNLALGAALDGAQAGDIDRMLTPHNIAAMRSAGLRPLTYRLRTELGIEAWHWNPVGSWSDPNHRQGYWTSSDRLGQPIAMSWGYKLPRRGDTVDNANDADYSRLTDGDEQSFWKSNPYLDTSYLRDGQPHWQWLIVRLPTPEPVDTIRIDWATPYAIRYEVQYWTGPNEYGGRWETFPHGVVEHGVGGDALLHLADQPVTARFVRVLLEQGSQTALPGAHDWRDKAGFAVREIALGRTEGGRFVDLVKHALSHKEQTFTHVSSTDPWHRAVDRDADLEQVGLDRIYASSLGNGEPIMLPVGLLFDTPDNAAAELRYVQRRGYPLRQVELGEEPDGQYGEAEDYGALYLALAERLKAENPGVAFGGPSLQSALTDVELNSDPDRSWNSHFIRYLQARGRLGDLGFFSFEHYPFDDICGDIHARLIEQNHLMHRLMTRLADEGVPRDIPWVISEYGFSAYSGRAMSEMPSALLMANIIGQFLSEGGDAAYLFGYEPNVPTNQHLPCAGYGNMMLHLADAKGQAAQPMPSYYTARLITGNWLMASGGQHEILPSTVEGIPGEWVKAYAIRRPDHRLGLLLINRSPKSAYTVQLATRDQQGQTVPIADGAEVSQYGPAQYTWQDDGPHSHPVRNNPPVQSRLAKSNPFVTLPAESLTVVVN